MTRHGCLGIETLIGFVDGRVEAGVREQVEQHASQCDECREVLSSLVASGTSLASVTRPAPPELATAEARLGAGTQVGRYVIAQVLGTGGMGVVYAADDPALGRTVAVKVLRGAGDLNMQARLWREAQTMARLAHPNVVAVHDVGAFGDDIFVAMEYVEGETLARWLSKPHPLGELLRMFGAAGRGLAAAHAAGIVHRDFKPANVLIGNDGRVCVGDFGLARAVDGSDAEPATSDPEPAAISAASPDAPTEYNEATAQSDLTMPGALLGTPYFMAPELFAGASADERSDQYSFCVALLTAMHGGPAIATGIPDPAARAARLRELAATRRFPRQIRAALDRGLAVDPAARFGSLDQLLDALAPPERPARWKLAAGAVLLVGLVAFAWWSTHQPVASDERCTGAAAAYAATWSPQRRGAVAAAFTASKAPFAAAAVQQVKTTLDDYAARWTQAHTATCRATRILGEQTEATLELRMTCLERRRQEVAALVDTFATADTAVVTRAVQAAAELTDVASCADVAALRQVVPPPSDAATRAKLAALTTRLAEARAKLETGTYVAGLALARPIAADARALGYGPFVAEAEYVQGMLEAQLGDPAHAEATLDAAMLSAEAARHDEISARARVELVFLIGEYEHKYDRALALAPLAAAAIARLGGSPEIESRLESARGAIDYVQDKLDPAVAHLEKAVALAERAHGPDHPSTAAALRRLGSAVLAQGHPDRAATFAQRALAISERVLGPDHPAVAGDLRLLGNAHVDGGKIVLAEQELRRALAIGEAALGSEHVLVTDNMTDLARAIRAQGRDEEALALDRRAVALGERRMGPEHPTHAEHLLGLATTLTRTGRYAEATEQLHRAEAIFTKVYGPDHVYIVKVHFQLADILARQSRWRDAATAYDRLIPALEKSQNIGDYLVVSRLNLADCALELHQPARALAALEPVPRAPGGQTPRIHGYTQFMVARAVWDGQHDRKRVCQLIAAARAELATAGPEAYDAVAELDGWLAKHPWARPPAK